MASFFPSYGESPCHIVPGTPSCHRELCRSPDAEVPEESSLTLSLTSRRFSRYGGLVMSSPLHTERDGSLGNSTSPNHYVDNRRRGAEIMFGERLILHDVMESPHPANVSTTRVEQIVPATPVPTTASLPLSSVTSSRAPTSPGLTEKRDVKRRLNLCRSRARKQRQRANALCSPRHGSEPCRQSERLKAAETETLPFGGSEDSIFF
ncbi:hypothetical protein V1264_018164 [Littorina saxatilis]|uniref:Uncharacterized protein n=1 Tax=Littorina saxatilis TaxID=31220 RepID=A0AAN9BDH3_9CAEN